MIQKDYIERILEQLNGFLLAMAGHKERDEFELCLDQAKHAYDSFNIDRTFILSTPTEELLQYLNEHKFSSQEIERLGFILKEEGDVLQELGQRSEALENYKKALDLLLTLSEVDKTYSLLREEYINNLNIMEIKRN